MKKVAVVLMALALVNVGCSSVTKEQIQKFRKADADERKAVTIRPGFEAEVLMVRSRKDAVLDEMEKAAD